MGKHRVTAGVTVSVVDELEAVEIKIDKACRCAVAAAERNVAHQLAHEGAAVEQRCKLILIGGPFDLLEPRLRLPQFAAQRVHSPISAMIASRTRGVNSPSGMPRTLALIVIGTRLSEAVTASAWRA
jgi:hypothetical protein